MMVFILIAVPVFIYDSFQLELLNLVLISIIVVVILVPFSFVMSRPFRYWYFAKKIEYNQEEIIVHRFVGKAKFRFDEKPVKIGRMVFQQFLFHIIGIRRLGFSFTNVMIPEYANNIDEIVALFKRIGNQ